MLLTPSLYVIVVTKIPLMMKTIAVGVGTEESSKKGQKYALKPSYSVCISDIFLSIIITWFPLQLSSPHARTVELCSNGPKSKGDLTPMSPDKSL